VRQSLGGKVGSAVIEIGASLTHARIRRRIDLAEAAKETRLRERYLHALEQEEFDQLPPGSYRRAFLRTYASFLDLDADLLVDEYVARYEHHKYRYPAAAPPIPVQRPGRRRRRGS
jgi:cytoskeletal protein RodZ